MVAVSRATAVSCLVSLGATALAVGLRWLLDPLLGDTLTVAMLFGAVAVATWFGGVGPAVLAAGVGYVASAYLFIEPRGELGLDQSRNVVGLLAYLLVCAIVIGFGQLARVGKHRSQVARAAAVEHGHEMAGSRLAVEELTESERRVRLILESITDGFFTLDREWRFDYMNPEAGRILGRLPETLIGKVLWEEYPGTLGTEFERVYREAGANISAGSFEGYYPDHDCWYEIRVYPAPNNGLSTYFRDVSERRRSQAELQASENRWRLALDSAELGAWNVDMATGKLNFDARSQNIFTGAAAPEMSYAQAMDAIHPEDRMQVELAITRTVQPEWAEPYSQEYRVVRPDGSVRWVFAQGRATFEGEGLARRAASFDGTVADITDRKHNEAKLREADEQFRTLADNMPQLAWIAKPGTDGEIEWFNRSWLNYTGSSVEQVRGPGRRALHHPDHGERVAAKFAHHVREGLDWEDTFPLRGRDGQFRWFLSRMSVIRNEAGVVTRMFGTNTDVTEQREMAERLQQQAEALSAADRRKDEFLATLAHELRNPLAPIRSSLEVLRRAGNDADMLRRSRQVMERQLIQMTRLVDDLLDVSRISSNKLALRTDRIELAAVLHSAVETSRPLLDASGAQFSMTLPAEPVFLEADLTRLAQVFMNLLNNAAKFTDSDGRIDLTAELRGDQVMVRVQDTGIGIPVEHLPRIFEMFSQVSDSLDRSQGGLGIGLSLVRRLVELHGGRVEAHSSGLGLGSAFTVYLPVAHAQDRVPVATERPIVQGNAGLRVLVVDDNVDAATSLTMVLDLMGYESRAVHEGPCALEAAAAWRPDLVMLDIGMPGMNGYEVAERIRAQPWGAGTTLIALTGWGQDEDRRRSHAAGFDRHLVKPLDPETLEELLAEWVPPPPSESSLAPG